MVKVNGVASYDPKTMKVKASLFADSKSDVTSGMTVEGLREGYTLDAGSSCITADKDFAFLDSSGSWHW